MADKQDLQKNLVELANKAADQFAAGKIPEALGICGVLLALVAIVVLLIGLPGNDIDSVKEEFALVLGVNGILFISLSGYLYHQRIAMRHESLMKLVDGYFSITSKLAEKINPETVSASNVNAYAEKFLDSAYKLLSDQAPIKPPEKED